MYIRVRTSKSINIHYKGLILWIKSRNYQLIFTTNSTYPVMEKTLLVVYDLYLSSQLVKLILTLFKMRKNILRAISMLISVNKKVFSKKRDLPSLFFIEKDGIIISKVSSILKLFYLGNNISFASTKTMFHRKSWLHCIDLTTEIDERFD